MGINYIGGATNTALSATSVSVTYSPTAGNIVMVFVAFGNSVVSNSPPSGINVVDSASHSLTVGPALVEATDFTGGLYGVVSFYYSAVAGITGFTANWTNASLGVTIGVVEYSGNNGVNANLANNTGTTSTAFLTVALDDSNDFFVGALAATAISTLSLTTGNQREIVSPGSTYPALVIADNTASTPTSVSLQATVTGVRTGWAAVGIELRTVIPVALDDGYGISFGSVFAGNAVTTKF